MTILKSWAHWLSCVQTLQSHSLCSPLALGVGKVESASLTGPCRSARGQPWSGRRRWEPTAPDYNVPSVLASADQSHILDCSSGQFLGHCSSAPSVLSERLLVSCYAPDLGWDPGAVKIKKFEFRTLGLSQAHVWQSVFLRLPWLVAIVWNAFFFFF